jgi:peptidoglycan/xylan/chitin deacetylase (PgdA/CDA1 family)
MGLKHKLKLWLRNAYARLLFHSGAHALVNRCMPRRFLILAGHCVSAPCNAKLPRDMKIEGAKLERILTWLGRRYELTSVGAGYEALQNGSGRSLVALSMDDGYKDNRTHLLPLLQRVGAPATVYLESRPLDEQRSNWSHKFFAILESLSPEEFVHRFSELSTDKRSNILLNQLVPHGEATPYHVKRMLKYEVPPAERRRVIDAMFEEQGGDEHALTTGLYMSWDDARALQRAGVELGGHTVHHEILSRLDVESTQSEIAGCRAALQRELGSEPKSFAYPFGRSWDFDEQSARVAREAGFRSATTTHAGTNKKGDDPYRLKRWMIDEDAELHLIACEAAGGFDLLRRFGLDLSD